MSDTRRLIFKNIIGDTKATIDAIQRFIKENSSKTVNDVETEIESAPAESINRILRAVADAETNSDIDEILKKL